MTVESDIFDLLKGLVSNRVYPDTAPAGVARPYITYHQIGGRAIGYTDNTVPDHKHGMFQINVWADSRAQSAALSLQVELAFLTASVFQARPAGGVMASHEPDLNLFGSMQDFDVWSER